MPYVKSLKQYFWFLMLNYIKTFDFIFIHPSLFLHVAASIGLARQSFPKSVFEPWGIPRHSQLRLQSLQHVLVLQRAVFYQLHFIYWFVILCSCLHWFVILLCLSMLFLYLCTFKFLCCCLSECPTKKKSLINQRLQHRAPWIFFMSWAMSATALKVQCVRFSDIQGYVCRLQPSSYPPTPSFP